MWFKYKLELPAAHNWLPQSIGLRIQTFAVLSYNMWVNTSGPTNVHENTYPIAVDTNYDETKESKPKKLGTTRTALKPEI